MYAASGQPLAAAAASRHASSTNRFGAFFFFERSPSRAAPCDGQVVSSGVVEDTFVEDTFEGTSAVVVGGGASDAPVASVEDAAVSGVGAAGHGDGELDPVAGARELQVVRTHQPLSQPARLRHGDREPELLEPLEGGRGELVHLRRERATRVFGSRVAVAVIFLRARRSRTPVLRQERGVAVVDVPLRLSGHVERVRGLGPARGQAHEPLGVLHVEHAPSAFAVLPPLDDAHPPPVRGGEREELVQHRAVSLLGEIDRGDRSFRGHERRRAETLVALARAVRARRERAVEASAFAFRRRGRRHRVQSALDAHAFVS